MGREQDRAMLHRVRDAFAAGESGEAEDLLATALENGMPWDAVTRAAAEGVARRHQSAANDIAQQHRSAPSKEGRLRRLPGLLSRLRQVGRS